MSDTKKTKVAPPLSVGKVTKVSIVFGIGLMLSACGDSEGQQKAALTGQCTSAKELAGKIAPVIGGELAAFNVSEDPQKMPALTFKTDKGVQTDIAAFEGKTILFNLWATWCAPCREEMPAFDALQSEFGGEKFDIIPVSVDRGGPEKPLAFYDEIGLKHLPFYQDETMGVFNSLKKQSLAFGLPVTILLDEEGCILGSLNGPAKWDGEDAKTLIRTAIDSNS